MYGARLIKQLGLMNYYTTADYNTVIVKRFMEQNVDSVGLLLFPPEVLYKSKYLH